MTTIDEVVLAAPDANGVVIAGPGAGKSFQIGRRNDHLLDRHEVQPGDILILTLTNETKRTLRGRFPTIPVRTVHGYALTTLNKLGATGGVRVADRWETHFLVSRDVQRLLRFAGIAVSVRRIRKYLRDRGAGFRDEQTAESELTHEEEIIQSTWLSVRQFLALRLFEDFAPDLLRYLREGRALPDPPRSILVDEYQDLTPEELDLIRAVGKAAGAGVFACGDDRQSIYGFRRADPGALARFPAVYGSPDPAYLEVSRRNPARVVGLAEGIAVLMPPTVGGSGRPGMSSLPKLGEGEVRIIGLPSMKSEARWIVRDIKRRRDERREDTIAVIVPRDLGHYVDVLNESSTEMHAGLTFEDSRTSLPLSNDESFRIAYSLLRLAADGNDELAWRTLVELAPNIGEATRDRLFQSGEPRLSAAIRLLSDAHPKLAALLVDADAVAAAAREHGTRDAVTGAVDLVISRLGVPVVPWADIAAAGQGQAGDEDDEIEASTSDDWGVALAECRRVVYRTSAERREGDSILVYTVYGAKGQQWRHVYLLGCYEQGFLDRGAVGEGGRRLYVAVTRSEWSLTITKPDYVDNFVESTIGVRAPNFPDMLDRARRSRSINIERPGTQAVQDLRRK